MSNDREKAEIGFVVYFVMTTVLTGLAMLGVYPFRQYFVESMFLFLATLWMFVPILSINVFTRSVSVLDLSGPRQRVFKWFLICATISGAVTSIVWRSLT